MRFFGLLAIGAGLVSAAPIVSDLAIPAASELSSRQAGSACFIIGNTVLPKETSDFVNQLRPRITCNNSRRTLSNVPDVTADGVSFSSINFATSSQAPLQFALSRFATPTPLRSANLAQFQRQLDVYIATEAGIRSVNGNLAIKVPKFFLQFQISRIQTAQGNPPRAAGLQVNHLLEKVLKNSPRESQLHEQVRALARSLA
ncbi:uncharacterized protein QC764_001450 [Podospora pseudoanserina]|uniref:DUF7143 domain-containing protein n=1 Tax=Podospora pseudoanserina TaxID=2609844 RepID=A0ABR0HIK8_9PEZI|nr:hypothetical protein QC764_001450 [Podospora pseudoanserina]